ncbi:MAG TPA: CBS domain-containing protein [Firmicutes bacterium]|nr:CBS domain-containing protein [Bacillota bacterium]
MECPYCGYDNIKGVDLCGSCGTDLAGLDLPAEQAVGERRSLYDVKLGELYHHKPLTVTPDTPVSEALARMKEQVHGATFVIDKESRLVGIFTERDLIHGFALGDRDLSTPVQEVMTKNPDALTVDASLSMAMNLMGTKGYRHIPIVDDDKRLIGFSSIRGILSYFRTHVVS